MSKKYGGIWTVQGSNGRYECSKWALNVRRTSVNIAFPFSCNVFKAHSRGATVATTKLSHVNTLILRWSNYRCRPCEQAFRAERCIFSVSVWLALECEQSSKSTIFVTFQRFRNQNVLENILSNLYFLTDIRYHLKSRKVGLIIYNLNIWIYLCIFLKL